MRNKTACDLFTVHKWNYMSIILTAVMNVVTVFCRAVRMLTLEQAMKAKRENRAIAVLFL